MKSHEIKNKLEERRMEVSENSWEKLASQLDANDQKKKKRVFYVPYAACLALIFGLIAFMFVKNGEHVESETIVDTNTKEIIKQEEKSKTPIMLKDEINDEMFKEALVQSEETKKIETTKIQNEKTAQSKQIVQQLKPELQKEIKNAIVVTKIDILSKDVPLEKIESVIAQNEVITRNDKELKASIAALSVAENIKITNQEIDQLLKEAQQSLTELDVKEEKVDVLRFATADELLNEVEYELDRSFKQKVFELIKHKVQERRSVVLED